MSLYDNILQLLRSRLRTYIQAELSVYAIDIVTAVHRNGTVTVQTKGNIRLVNYGVVEIGDSILTIVASSGNIYGYIPDVPSRPRRRKSDNDGYSILSAVYVDESGDDEEGHLMIKMFDTSSSAITKLLDLTLSTDLLDPPNQGDAGAVGTIMDWFKSSYVYVNNAGSRSFEFVASRHTISFEGGGYPVGEDFYYLSVDADGIHITTCVWPALATHEGLTILGRYLVKPTIVKSDSGKVTIFSRYHCDTGSPIFNSWYADVIMVVDTATGNVDMSSVYYESTGFYSHDFGGGGAILLSELLYVCACPTEGGTSVVSIYPGDHYSGISGSVITCSDNGVWSTRYRSVAPPPPPSGYTTTSYIPTGVVYNSESSEFVAHVVVNYKNEDINDIRAELYRVVFASSSTSLEFVQLIYDSSTVRMDVNGDPCLFPTPGNSDGEAAHWSMNFLGEGIIEFSARELETAGAYSYIIYKTDGSIVFSGGETSIEELRRLDQRRLPSYGSYPKVFCFSTLKPRETNFFRFKPLNNI